MAISADPPDKAREVVEAYGLEYPVLSDVDGEAIRAFGVEHRRRRPDGRR